tara:strand:- start:21 stop:143 length:123 start_codon:yes stop_codon:yes gene_type:complete
VEQVAVDKAELVKVQPQEQQLLVQLTLEVEVEVITDLRLL